MALEPATMDPLEGPFNLDELRLWVSDTRKIASGKSFQVIRLGDLFDELLFGDAEKFEPLVGNILDAKKQYRFRADLNDDLSISVINLPNGKIIMGVINPVKKDAKFLINGHPVVIDAVKPTMVIGLQYKDDKDNTGRGLFIVSQASDTIEPPKILTEPQGGTFLEGDVADVIATAIGYKDVIAIKNGDVLDGIKAAALPVPILPGTSDIYVFGFVHPKDPNMITWTKPASIRRGEAEPAQIVSQSQSLEADAGTETTLFADVIGTPPPLIKWVEKINGINGPVVATGREFTTKVLNTRTFVPIAVNRYKVGADGKFDPNGTLKDFAKEGDAVTITKVGQPQPAPNPIVAYNDLTDEITLGALHAGKTLADLRIIINDDEPIIPTSMTVYVGDRDIPIAKIVEYYMETVVYNQSPNTVSTQPFNTTVVPADYTLTSNAINLSQASGSKLITSTIQSGGDFPGDDFISGKKLKRGNRGWIRFKKGTRFGTINADPSATHKSPDSKMFVLGEYNDMGTGFAFKYNGVNIVSDGLTDEVPYVQLNFMEDGSVVLQRLKVDETVFDTLSTPGVAKITQDLVYSINVAAISANNVLVEPRYYGVTSN